MFGIPRCREWTPLTTQQLRLRSMIQIVGYNIRPPEWCSQQCSYYLTLHHTTMSAPFYTSEKICSPHPKWKEIDSEITQRLSSTNVVIRVWCHIIPQFKGEKTLGHVQDTIIETWGVYFSGLRYLGANLASTFNSDCFKSNTLVFQMHGGYFCSYKSLKLDIIPAENEMDHGSLSSDSSSKTNTPKINLESKFRQLNKRINKEVRSGSQGRDKEYSKSQSPVERGFQQNFPTSKSRSTMNISFNPRDYKSDDDRKTLNPNHIYEHSPNSLDVKEFSSENNSGDSLMSQDNLTNQIDLSETAENYDLRNETAGTLKYRYVTLNFLKSEIRQSYNASKLQSLHLLQYAIKKKQDAVQEIKERIYKKSALTESTLSRDSTVPLKTKCPLPKMILFGDDNEVVKSHDDLKNGRIREEKAPVSNGPRLTLKLNDLLSYKSKPSPLQRAEHIRLTKQLEILHFKRLILSDERDAKLANLRRLKERQAKLFEENQDIGLELMQNYHALSRRTEKHKESRDACSAMRELAARSHAALASKRADLLLQLQRIFYIDQKDSTTWTICGVPLPICGDEGPASSALPDAVAAGYVAQAACVAATLLNQPLRYKITLLGSATKILDITPDLPDPNIPLFARGGDTTLFRYAMFLLNKCIAQLLWGRNLSVYDMRPTLSNLQRLLTTPSNLTDTSKLFGTYHWLTDSQCGRTQSLRSLVASDRGKYRPFNRFKETVEGQSPQKAYNSRGHKHSRSVGSYQDDQVLSTLAVSTTSIMGSESNIYNMKLSSAAHLKTYSDSELSNQTSDRNLQACDGEKIIFSLGDDTLNLETHLVRMSTNNNDKVQDNVKKICTEITDFCSGQVSIDNVRNGLDIIEREGRYVYETAEGNIRSRDIEPFFHSTEDLDKVDRTSDRVNNVERQVSGDIDIAKYMERKLSVDIQNVGVNCDSCDSNVGGACDMTCGNSVRDVIVIPSAEAILEATAERGESEAEEE